MTCNTERNARIVELRKSGLFPFEIAKALGISRNAVIGVCGRAGLCDAGVDRSLIAKKAGTGKKRGTKTAPECFRKLVLQTADRCGAESAGRQWGVSGYSVRAWRKLSA